MVFVLKHFDLRMYTDNRFSHIAFLQSQRLPARPPARLKGQTTSPHLWPLTDGYLCRFGTHLVWTLDLLIKLAVVDTSLFRPNHPVYAWLVTTSISGSA